MWTLIIGWLVTVIFAAGLPAASKQGDVSSGKELFHQCSGCHNTDSDDVKGGPSLKRLFKHAKLKNGKPVTDASVREVVNSGGNGMPPFKDELSDQDKSDLIAYLKTR